MRINPSEIKVDYGNGKVVTLGNDANWERIRESIDRLFQWDKSYPDPFMSEAQAVTKEPAEVTAPITALDPKLRIIDRIVIALGKSGTPLSTKEMYQKMVADGYVNKAIKPENNVHSKGRKYPSIVKMTRGVFSLLPEGWELFRQLEQNGFRSLSPGASEGDSQDAPANARLIQPPQASASRQSGAAEAGDYLLLALYNEGGSATPDGLIDPMLDCGWRPSSATRDKKRHNVSSVAFTNKEYVDRAKGRITLNEKGRERLISRVNTGILTMDEEALNRLYQQNSPASDAQASNTGLFVQT